MRVIAIEEHFITPMYRERVGANEFRNFYLQSRGAQLGHDIVEQNSDLGAKRVAHMDAAGIDMQVLSFGSPGTEAFAADVAIPMARDANDRLFRNHQVVSGKVRRISPRCRPRIPRKPPRSWSDASPSCGFKGAMIHGHQQGRFLDDRKYWPIFERAEALDVPIYLHPTLPHPDAMKSYFAGYEDLARAGWGFSVDTSCHFLRIVFAGVFDAYPKLKIILGHLGEGIPFAMHRLNDHTEAAARRRGLKRAPLDYLKDNMLVTTSGNWYEPAFQLTLQALGVDKILFAVDWPYEANSTGVAFLKSVSLSDAEREKIAHRNAEYWLKL